MSEPPLLVHWTETAARDLEDLIAFIAADSPGNARRVLTRLQERAAALEVHPARGRIVPELASFGLSAWRELVVKPYRLIYRAEAKRVYVLAVVDGRRDLEDLLLKRLVRP
jgi:plasmid stabilization system protein ParE